MPEKSSTTGGYQPLARAVGDEPLAKTVSGEQEEGVRAGRRIGPTLDGGTAGIVAGRRGARRTSEFSGRWDMAWCRRVEGARSRCPGGLRGASGTLGTGCRGPGGSRVSPGTVTQRVGCGNGVMRRDRHRPDRVQFHTARVGNPPECLGMIIHG